MDTIQTFKCPCCGAALAYSGEKQALHCTACGNDFSTEALQQLTAAENNASGKSKFDWEKYEERSFDEAEAKEISGYSCPSCGAEISGDAALGATVCPYCGNAAIISKQFEGVLRPDCIIPFRLNKKAAMDVFEREAKKAPFLPDEFKSKKKIEEMTGIYAPFWLFGCECNADIIYRAEKHHCWSDSDYNYVRTDHYRLVRSGHIGFANVPVDASKKIDNVYTESIEPYNYDEAVDFNTAYLSGFLADKYDEAASECEERANERIKLSSEAAFMNTASAYQSVVTERSSIGFSDGKIRYALLPMWLLNIKYNGKTYKYAINGQTGKTVGEYPVDKKKKWKYFARVAGICYAVAAAIVWFLLS